MPPTRPWSQVGHWTRARVNLHVNLNVNLARGLCLASIKMSMKSSTLRGIATCFDGGVWRGMAPADRQALTRRTPTKSRATGLGVPSAEGTKKGGAGLVTIRCGRGRASDDLELTPDLRSRVGAEAASERSSRPLSIDHHAGIRAGVAWDGSSAGLVTVRHGGRAVDDLDLTLYPPSSVRGPRAEPDRGGDLRPDQTLLRGRRDGRAVLPTTHATSLPQPCSAEARGGPAAAGPLARPDRLRSTTLPRDPFHSADARRACSVASAPSPAPSWMSCCGRSDVRCARDRSELKDAVITMNFTPAASRLLDGGAGGRPLNSGSSPAASGAE